jgi:hypothetical protein
VFRLPQNITVLRTASHHTKHRITLLVSDNRILQGVFGKPTYCIHLWKSVTYKYYYLGAVEKVKGLIKAVKNKLIQ